MRLSLHWSMLAAAWLPLAAVATTTGGNASAGARSLDFLDHGRSMVDAHNCYPDDGHWNDRIQHALDAGFPVSIEQDLAWYVDPATGNGRVVVSHSVVPTGTAPALRAYFFERVRPIVEKALKAGQREHWPLIVLHFDFKDDRPAILKAVWKLLGDYQPWLSTAVKTGDPTRQSPIDRKPILVVTEDSDAQAAVFFDDVPVGGRLRVFGSAHTRGLPPGTDVAAHARWAATAPPEQLLTGKASNYRRWWNNSWWVVEQGGQRNAGPWTRADDRRLRALVDYAHRQGFWIRFYTLDGFSAGQDRGWSASYNFGSMKQVLPRWKAAIAAGVDFIATDQYQALAGQLGTAPGASRHTGTSGAGQPAGGG